MAMAWYIRGLRTQHNFCVTDEPQAYLFPRNSVPVRIQYQSSDFFGSNFEASFQVDADIVGVVEVQEHRRTRKHWAVVEMAICGWFCRIYVWAPVERLQHWRWSRGYVTSGYAFYNAHEGALLLSFCLVT